MAFGEDAGGVVRVAAGEWVARFLAPHLAGLTSAHRDLTVELDETHLEPDLDRREADLFVRHGLPARGHLVRVGLGVEAIRAGAGLGILPCFVGDADPTLVRLTAPIAELGADYWLVVHPDVKTVPRVRRLIDWVRAAFKEGRPALQGLLGRVDGDRARSARR